MSYMKGVEDILQALIRLALHRRASDIHLIRQGNSLQIALRQNDQLVPVAQDIWDGELFEYLKFRAGMDLTRPSDPQSGRFAVDGMSCRFAVLSGSGKENGVLRLLNTRSDLDIDDLSDRKDVTDFLHHLCSWRQGLVLFTGPTGSGKTTTLHAILRQASLAFHHKCVSLEDPVEIADDAYIQLAVNKSTGLTYEQGIEELLRHDPDVICIGETRSPAVCRKIFTASLTGHFTLSTIHAKDGRDCLYRLMDMGITPAQIREQVSAIISQRLYENPQTKRKVCLHEIITRQDIQEILETGQYPIHVRKLEDLVWEAAQNGTVPHWQAAQDFPR